MNGEKNNAPKKKRNSIFFRSYFKDGKGVEKNDAIKVDEYNAKNFFKLYFRRIGNIIKINWIYILGNFPVLFLLLAISGNFSHTAAAPQSQYYPVIFGMMNISENSAALAPMLGIHGIMGSVTSYSVLDYILLGLSALFIVTFGLVNTGCAYLERNIVRGEHLFLLDDFFTTVKQNFKQGLIFGIIDLIILGLSGYSIVFYIANYNSYFILFFCSIAVLAFYLFIRQNVYMMLVTFDLPLIKILKNSFILSSVSLGKNFIALFAVLLTVFVAFFGSMIFMPIGIIIALMFLFSTGTYIFTYFTFPKMKEIMIDPYYPNYDKEEAEE
ncbi:MAG: DUF624 domain-containing protein [Clostridiales bacterium]|nr:DUF624 domain-containing protein [Clostridiales bacterium]